MLAQLDLTCSVSFSCLQQPDQDKLLQLNKPAVHAYLLDAHCLSCLMHMRKQSRAYCQKQLYHQVALLYSHMNEVQDEEEGFLEKDELPSAQEQMGLYRPLQNRNDGQDMDAAALDEYVRERFVAPSQSYAEVDDTQASEVGQQGLQPTPQDPKLWLVQCKTGSEREAVVSLMQKCVDLAMKGTPLAIKAVFTQDHLKVGP